MIPALAVQKAMYEAISGLGYMVFDYLPDEPTFPYVFIGDDTLVGNPTKTNDHYQAFISISVFSNYQGTKEAKEMLSNIQDVIKNLSLGTEWSIGHVQLIQYRMMADTRPDVTHGYMQLLLEITKIN